MEVTDTMLIPVVLALLAAAAPPQDSARGSIRGTVQSEPSGLPVALAVVEADDGRQHGARHRRQRGRLPSERGGGDPDAAGAPPGARDHGDGGDWCPPGETLLDVAITHRPIALAPVRVARPFDPRADSTAADRPDLGVVMDHRRWRTPAGWKRAGRRLRPGPGDPGQCDTTRCTCAARPPTCSWCCWTARPCTPRSTWAG